VTFEFGNTVVYSVAASSAWWSYHRNGLIFGIAISS
jgi:hypothetical protein